MTQYRAAKQKNGQQLLSVLQLPNAADEDIEGRT
jgi:hypothetical protein